MHTGSGTSPQQEEGADAEEIGQDSADTAIVEYKVGDAVKTVNGLVADVVAVNLQSGTYDIKYRKDADVDTNVCRKYFKPYVPPQRRKRPSETKNWDYRDDVVETMEDFIARTGVSSEFNVLPSDVKRRRRP
jgi:hypothetical protein